MKTLDQYISFQYPIKHGVQRGLLQIEFNGLYFHG